MGLSVTFTTDWPDISSNLVADAGALYRSPQWWSLYQQAQADGRRAEFVVVTRAGLTIACLPLVRGIRTGGGDDHVTRLLQSTGTLPEDARTVMAGSWNSGWFSPLMAPGAGDGLICAAVAARQALDPAEILMWSYLGEDIIALVKEAFPACTILPCDSDGIIDIGDDGFDSWLARMSGSRRHKIRRELQQFERSGAVVDVCPATERIPQLAQLLAAHKASHGGMGDVTAMERLIQGQVDIFGNDLLSVEAHVGGEIHGACTVLVHEGALYCRSYGAADQSVPFEYFVLGYYTPIQISRNYSATLLHVGRGTEETKTHRGAHFPPRWTAFIGPGRGGTLAHVNR